MLRQAIAIAGALGLAPSPSLAYQVPADCVLLGAGIRSRPAYDGAAASRAEAIPVIRYYGRPWFARTTQGMLEAGVRTRPDRGLTYGAQLAYEGGRAQAESAFLESHRIDDIDPGASFGAHAEWDVELGRTPITLLARLRRHADGALGFQADLRFTGGVYGGGRFNAAIFLQSTWADREATQARYGITPAQAASGGLPAYEAGAGILHVSAGLLWSYDLDREWMWVGGLEARRLHGSARRSPLVEEATATYFSLGLAYRF
jgi:outer membrane scaffolding protein for murein synthesis (MipA/OmpV family)